MLDERKLAVLRAIVEDYVSTTEPVGSKSLVDRHGLDVSPATIRNDMAVLEEQGFIAQPHTSAGRIPTDKGYRLFVDRLSSVKPMSSAERRAIETFLAGAYSLDEVVTRTVRLLAQLTRQVAVVQYPRCPSLPCGTSSWSRSRRSGCCLSSSRTPAGWSRPPWTCRIPRSLSRSRICARYSTRAWMGIGLPTRPRPCPASPTASPSRAAERGGRVLRSPRQPRRAARGTGGFRRCRQPGRPRFRQGAA